MASQKTATKKNDKYNMPVFFKFVSSDKLYTPEEFRPVYVAYLKSVGRYAGDDIDEDENEEEERAEELQTQAQ